MKNLKFIKLQKSKKKLFLSGFITLLTVSPCIADILNSRNTPYLRIRVGDNSSGSNPNYVEYNPLAPAYFAGLGAPTGQTESVYISTNNISGGSGVFKVRVITDVNAKFFIFPPLTGTFSYDSSTGMQCITPTTCGSTSIPFTKIAWNARDNDTLNTVFQYDGSSNQTFQIQTDTNSSSTQFNTRHRNFYQYRFINDQLFPAGTYEGIVTIYGQAN